MPFPFHDTFAGSRKAVFRRRRRKANTSSDSFVEVVRRKLLPWITTSLAFVFAAGIAYSAWNSLYQPQGVTISAIAVPKTLSDKGFTSDVIAEKIRDNLLKIYSTTPHAMAAMPKEPLDISIPGTGMSVRKLVAWVSAYFPESWHHIVSGEIVSDNSAETKFVITLRVNGKLLPTRTVDSGNLNDNLNSAVHILSRNLIEKVDLYQEAIALIKDERYADAEDIIDEMRSTLPSKSDRLGAVLNLKGYIVEHKPYVATPASNLNSPKSEPANLAIARRYYAEANTSISLTNLGNLETNRCWYASEETREYYCSLAEHHFRAAIELAPESADAHYSLGNFLYDRAFNVCAPGKTTELLGQAVQEFNAAMQLDDTKAETYQGMALARYLGNEPVSHDIVLGYFAAASRRDSSNNSFRNQLSFLRLEKDLRDPSTLLREIPVLNPDPLLDNIAKRRDKCSKDKSRPLVSG
ncbi:hypothetical protein AWB68_08223 [Caballeronia choica]|uniref:Tetratricopeptide repeat protein n=1 Tax=Caballeronia choica TaxID=326476 RepID=A0A158L2A9_9BURK|nr:hypothetical protein [Caballeronia choica]SAL86970.1 hypothetical protein AWB68_08223 [Caballeronia choica]